MPEAQTAEQTPAQTFTQDQVNAFVAEAKRKEREKVADYDDIKAQLTQRAEASQESATELDSLRERIEQAEKALNDEKTARARAESDALRASVAADKGIKARYISGETREEMEQSADSFREDARALLIGNSTPHQQSDDDIPLSSMDAGREWARQNLNLS